MHLILDQPSLIVTNETKSSAPRLQGHFLSTSQRLFVPPATTVLLIASRQLAAARRMACTAEAYSRSIAILAVSRTATSLAHVYSSMSPGCKVQ